MARKTSALPAISSLRARLILLLYFIPFFSLYFAAVASHRIGEFLLGVGALFVAALFVATVAFTTGRVLGGRIVWMQIGIGPILKRSVVGDRLVVRRALPVVVSGLVLPALARSGRDWRLINASGVAAYTVLFAVGAVMLPPFGAGAFCLSVAFAVGVTLSSRDPFSGRRIAARIFRRPTVQSDPALADPRRITAEHAAIDALFGDLATAERVLAELRATPGPNEAVALLESEILGARGDFDAALRVEVPIAADATSALAQAREARHRARRARLLLLAVEKDPSIAPQAVPAALNQLKQLAAMSYRTTADRSGRALFALQAGDLRPAAREGRICLALARTPLATADALCTLAVANSLQGKGKAARRQLEQAARIAPWYPRLTTVQQILASGSGAAVLPVMDTVADTSAVFNDPWSTLTRD